MYSSMFQCPSCSYQGIWGRAWCTTVWTTTTPNGEGLISQLGPSPLKEYWLPGSGVVVTWSIIFVRGLDLKVSTDGLNRRLPDSQAPMVTWILRLLCRLWPVKSWVMPSQDTTCCCRITGSLAGMGMVPVSCFQCCPFILWLEMGHPRRVVPSRWSC